MRIVLVPLLLVLLGPLLTPAQAQEPTEGADPPPPPERPAAHPQPQDRDDSPPPSLPPGQMERRRPPGPPVPGGPGRGGFRGQPGPGPQAQFNALIRLIAERRPDLAERLERLRRQEPERFRNVLAEALIIRLEDILGDERRGPELRWPGPPPDPRPIARFRRLREREAKLEAKALERQHRELEEHAGALERELHELEEQGAPPEARERVRTQLERTHNELVGIRERLEESERPRQPGPLSEERLRDLRQLTERWDRHVDTLEAKLHELEEGGAPPREQEQVRAELQTARQALSAARARLEEYEHDRRRAEAEEAFQRLHRRHEELERRSHDLAAELRELRERGEHSVRQPELMEALQRTVNEHFDVRTELREFELRRIHRELEHLQKAVEEMRADLERRARERDSIVERRIRMLLGEDTRGW